MYISDFRLVDILRDKMGEQEARTLVEYIEEKVEEKYVEARHIFATKEDLLKLELKILESVHKGNLETQKLVADSQVQTQKQFADNQAFIQKQFADNQVLIQKQFAETQAQTQKQFAETQKQFADNQVLIQKQFGETQKQIAKSKSDMLKWMFGMILTATVAIIGTILAVMQMGGWGN
ncbi:MAG: hypothetical protein ACKVOU_10980 [Cytophagales bacterium]